MEFGSITIEKQNTKQTVIKMETKECMQSCLHRHFGQHPFTLVDEKGTESLRCFHTMRKGRRWHLQHHRSGTVATRDMRGWMSSEVIMNGRLYRPCVSRFFSPDNYVQMPDNSQNFNRYSLLSNNPLKLRDPEQVTLESTTPYSLCCIQHGRQHDAGGRLRVRAYGRSSELSLLSSAA